MEQNLSVRSFNAVVWNFLGQFTSQIISLAIGLVMARLLSPHEYGLLAMSVIFNGISSVFIDGGFSSALIRKTNPTPKDLSTVFFFNNGMALLMSLIVILIAPLAADFFKLKELTLIIRILSLNFIILSLGTIQSLLLTKKLDYKTQSIIRMLSVIIAGGVSLFMAINGFGVWSLVVQIMIQSLVWVFGLWIAVSWRPILVFSKQSFKELFSFGSKLMLSSLLYEIFAQAYPVIIGRFFSSTQVGYYNRAESYQKITSYTISSMVHSVSFPALSLIQDDDLRLKEAYRRIIKMTMFVTVPLMAGLILIAHPLISILLTDKWILAVPYLQWLCVVGIFQPLHVISLNIVNVKGRSDLFLYSIIINKVLIILSIVVGFYWGILGLLVGQVITAILTYLLGAYLTNRFLKYSIVKQIMDVAPFFILSIIMCIIGYQTSLFVNNELVKMIIQIVFCMVFYYFFARIFKFSALAELSELITGIFKRREKTAS